MEPIVDVIIPVYRGAEETRACIESVLRCPQRTPHQVIVIDDASPDAELREYLDTLVDDSRIELIRQPENQGFVATANLGIWLHPERDVVLLNSDTEVANDWLDRLHACATTDYRIATVTPFSNNATLCSYPRIGEENALPSDLDTAALDDLFRRHNAGDIVDLPTGVGFCLYMTRAGIEGLGGFDEDSFGAGYGEEVDYCMRGRIAGWRNLLCAEVFVRHHGGVSFQETSAARREVAQRFIDKRFPDYPQLVTNFFNRDPPRPFRRAVDLARLCGSVRPRLLFISHNWGGGVDHHIQQLATALADQAEVLLLQPQRGDMAVLRWLRSGEELAMYLPLRPDTADPWLELLSGLGLSHLHYHHVQGFPPWILELADVLGLPYDVTLHDYLPVCPQLHFVQASGAYCGEPTNPAVCQRCLAERPHHWGLDIGEWRHRFLDWLANATRVIAPSADVSARISRYRSDLALVTWPHPEIDDTGSYALVQRSLKRRKVLLLGSLSDAKGLGLVSSAAIEAARQGMLLDLRVIGSIRRRVPLWPEANLSVHGEYAEADLPAILERERPDAFLFASVIPETFSYTLSLAMRTGLPILALDIGAIGERLRDYPAAKLLPSTIDGLAMAEELDRVPCAYAPRIADKPAMASSPGMPATEYIRRYLAPISSIGAVGPIKPAASQFYPQRGKAAEASPPGPLLYEHGVICGIAEARAQLERHLIESERCLVEQERYRGYVHDLQQQLKARDTEVTELKHGLSNFDRAHRRHVQHLETKVKALQARNDELQQSTFWRITGPLRWAVQRSRTTTSTVRSLHKRLPRGLALARRVLAEQGWRGLAAEIRRRQRQRVRFDVQLNVDYQVDDDIRPLLLPVVDDPEVSIIIPTYAQHELAYTCLKSLAEHLPGFGIEVLLIDDHAPEPAADALASIEGLTLIRNPENLGFLRSCNRAAEQARGRYLLLLNNDTLLLEGCLDALLRTFAEHEQVGAVGARLIYPDGHLQEAGGIVWKDGSAWNWGRGEHPEDPRFNYVREVDYCSAACLMVPTALFRELGGFDERYAPAYYEDTDLCLALRDRGYSVLYQPAATVVHFEGASHGTDESAGLKAYQVRNRDLFRQKWAIRLQHHLDNGVCPERERDRVDGPRVLWIEACMLTPDQDSGSLRTWRLLQLIRALGCKVTFMADNLQATAPYADQLRQAGIEVQSAPHTSSVSQYLDTEGAHQDVIVLCRHYIAIRYIDQVRRVAPQARLIFDTIDLHYLRLRRQAELDQNPSTRAAADLAYREELSIAERSDMTLVVSGIEAGELARELPGVRVEILSNVHDPLDEVAPAAGRQHILFVGGFQHPPNIDAVEFYAREIWPVFREDHPNVRTYIVGSRMPMELRRLGEAAGLDMLGYVADLQPLLAGCRLSVTPLRYGAGVKGKVNQSLAAGLPLVATAIAIEGMALEHERDVLVAEEPAKLVAAMSRLYADDRLWHRLSENGRQRIREQFSSEVARAGLRRILQTEALESK
ncbi:MAG: glycosyltransferase [Lamprobacter sp.]|uniref:glycosyltransferase n=1 Tax=Lamprobacter sp. TaxID=3100796 RepID=UPI002B2574DA|nr:glycosyltransferase [Lamprobacter sp.]MEA3638341.1 glycosyltransferase [Lamprobacter sp.]